MTSSRSRILFLLVGLALTLKVLHRPAAHTVVPIFISGADHWWNDASLYVDYAPLDFFRYPPLFAIVCTPLAWLGAQLGGVLWAWLSLGLYWFGLRRLLRDVLPGAGTDRRETAFLVLALVGALAGLWNGQSNALLTGLLLLGASSALRRRWWQAACFLALPVALKLTPLPLCLLLCVLWPVRLAPRFALCVSLGFLLPFLTRPPEVVLSHYREWASHLASSSNERWPGFRDGWTVWVVSQHLAEGGSGLPNLKEPMAGTGYRLLQIWSGLTVLAWTLWLKRRAVGEGREAATLTLAAGAGWLLLLGPAAEFPTFAFLAPFLAWAIVQRHVLGGRRLIELSALLILVLGWSSLTRQVWDVAPWIILSLPVGTALFLAWLVRIGISFASPNVGGSMTATPYRRSPSCRREFSSCPPRSVPVTCALPRPSNSPSARRTPTPWSRTPTF